MAKAKNSDLPPITRLLSRLTGARLCFGKAVGAGAYTVVPVAKVRVAGGGGSGREGEGSGGGGGGALDAAPVGYVEIGPEGTRFKRIRATSPSELAARSVSGLAAAAALALVVRNRRDFNLTHARRLLSR
ncbi:MAG: hypothetical protein H0T15_05435 [Thermoleophilaceae bacterium]|nr:hypothetical protein [Thermoleophilaceae bacterium]